MPKTSLGNIKTGNVRLT